MPASCPSIVPPPARESSSRAGVVEPTVEPAGTYPFTSIRRSNGTSANTHTLPPAPTLATTAFGTFWPATKFRFDAFGTGSPQGNTDAYPAAWACTTVTFSTTPVASIGTHPRR